MKRIKERPELLPLYLSLAVMCGSLLIYIAGPIRWIDKINFADKIGGTGALIIGAVILALIISIYFVSAFAGTKNKETVDANEEE